MKFSQNGILVWIARVSRVARRAGIFGIMGILVILLVLPSQSSGLGDVRAKVVINVSGLQNYQLHWNDRFPPGSTVMIYTEADDINHRRLVGVDYIFIIKDSNDNTVNASVIHSRYEDYRSDDFIKYQKKIDENLEDGTYIAEIHIFDLLNDSVVEEHYKNITRSLLNEIDVDDDDDDDDDNDDEIPDIPYMNRSDIMNSADLMAHQYKKIVQPFYVDKYANKYPVNRFTLENMSLDMVNIAPGVPIQINISAKNSFYDNGIISMDLILDGQIIDNLSSEIESYGSRDITFNVPTEVTSLLEDGNHTIEIVPTSENTVGFDLSTTLQVIQMEIQVPAKFYYSDIQINKLRAEPNETVMVTVKVENRGRAGNQSIGLLINNIPVEEKIVYVNSLEKKDVNFSIAKENAGEYRVQVNNSNLSKIFFVESGEEILEPIKVKVEEKQIPRIFIVAGLSILVVLVYIIRKKVKTLLDKEKK